MSQLFLVLHARLPANGVREDGQGKIRTQKGRREGVRSKKGEGEKRKLGYGEEELFEFHSQGGREEGKEGRGETITQCLPPRPTLVAAGVSCFPLGLVVVVVSAALNSLLFPFPSST